MRKNTFVCQLFFIGDSEGTADYVISITESWMTPTILMTLTFVVSAFIAFFTGTSWGTYAIVTPICVQMALKYIWWSFNTGRICYNSSCNGWRMLWRSLFTAF